MSFFGLHQSNRSLPSVTPSRHKHWTKIGPAETHLYENIKRLYWIGVEQELENIIRTLSAWQNDSNSDVNIEDEDEDDIYGYDTFLEQVSREARDFATRYAEKKAKEEAENTRNSEPVSDQTEPFSDLQEEEHNVNSHSYNDPQAEMNAKEAAKNSKNSETDSNQPGASSKLGKEEDDSDSETRSHSIDLKAEVKEKISSLPRLSGIEKRACMLLQAAGLLDMDKLIEYRPPLKQLGIWDRPAIPQLTLRDNGSLLPQFTPLRCKECTRIISGSMFTQGTGDARKDVCEDCYRTNHYGKRRYKKAYKHCILPEAITSKVSREMCHCANVPPVDEDGQARSLFPVPMFDDHENRSYARCKILNLDHDISLAKLQGLIIGATEEERLAKPSMVQSLMGKLMTDTSSSLNNKEKSPKPEKLPKALPKHRVYPLSHPNGGKEFATQAGTDNDVPLLFRRFTKQYPFGNVHMGLRIGPLIIENGVQHTKGGALISLREYPIFHDRVNVGEHQLSLAVSEEEVRHVWRQVRPVGSPKRYKAIMKQVVGVPFTGLLSGSSESKSELDFIRLLVSRSRIPLYDPGISHVEIESALKKVLKQLINSLQILIDDRVDFYLQSIVGRLLNPEIPLTWSWSSNNCQSFCDNLIDNDLFGSLISVADKYDESAHHSTTPKIDPLYLMSFVCPYEGYLKNNINTKYDVPYGLTEEYLLKFHFGLHDDADIIDTLQEYWFDWGAFGAPLYKNQELFPWDCTEAYGRHPTKCNECNLAKHILAFPFDSWSIAELHLHRDPHLYPPGDTSWMQNRLKVLTALSLLSRAAVGMAKSEKFRTTTSWLDFKSSHPQTQDPSKFRVKLGGIHRAQPCSHSFETGRYRRYLSARWAIRERQQQIEEYETLRDKRMEMPEYSAGGGEVEQYTPSHKKTNGRHTNNSQFWAIDYGADIGGVRDGGNDHHAHHDHPTNPSHHAGSNTMHHSSHESSNQGPHDHGGNSTHGTHPLPHSTHPGPAQSTNNHHVSHQSAGVPSHDKVSASHQAANNHSPHNNPNQIASASAMSYSALSHLPASNTHISSSGHNHSSPFSHSHGILGGLFHALVHDGVTPAHGASHDGGGAGHHGGGVFGGGGFGGDGGGGAAAAAAGGGGGGGGGGGC